MGAVAARISRSLPLVQGSVKAILPYLPLVIVLPLGTVLAPALVTAAIGLVLLRRADVRRLWAHPRVLLVGRIAIAAVVLAFLPSFVGDIADILG